MDAAEAQLALPQNSEPELALDASSGCSVGWTIRAERRYQLRRPAWPHRPRLRLLRGLERMLAGERVVWPGPSVVGPLLGDAGLYAQRVELRHVAVQQGRALLPR